MRKFLGLIFISMLVGGCGLRSHDEYRNTSGVVWSTTYNITYRADNDLTDSIKEVMLTVERSLSPFMQESLVSQINENRTTLTDSLFRRVLLASQEINRASGGLFDPTVRRLVELWGFGRKKHSQVPSQASIDSALMAVGVNRCTLRGDTLIKASPATEFDFSAISKGYGCDLIGRMFERNGCSDYLIEIGGELAVSGESPSHQPWHVMVDSPIVSDTVVHERLIVVELTDVGIATSGNYRNFRHTRDGIVGHTISPVTGHPIMKSTMSATVIAPNAMMADALATACMAMEPMDALLMINGMKDTEVLLVTMKPDGTYALQRTEGFPKALND